MLILDTSMLNGDLLRIFARISILDPGTARAILVVVSKNNPLHAAITFLICSSLTARQYLSSIASISLYAFKSSGICVEGLVKLKSFSMGKRIFAISSPALRSEEHTSELQSRENL